MEMRKIINDCHKKAKDIINKNKDLLKLIAEALLEYETLTKEQIDYLVENGKMPKEDDENLESLSITRLREMAKEKGIKDYSKMNKAELLKELED
jgi:cell division protease FtsH